MEEFTICKSRNKVFNNNSIGNRILFPMLFYSKTEELCKKEVEYAGQLICKQIDDTFDKIYVVEYIAILSEGEPCNVMLNTRVDFLEKSKYIGIDFHTHREGGDKYYWDKFSDKDYEMLETESSRGDYSHVLFTPTHILTWGVHKCTFDVYNVEKDNDNENIFQNYKNWEEHLNASNY